jgi:predicted AlkP superfamily phosphohydrolase/phosphomutase
VKKLVVIGLDCATPQLVFDQYRDRLPNFSKLMDEGVYGKLFSTQPPITVPAWTAMMTSKDPGQLGFYGFRNRAGYDYDDLFFANANYVTEKTVWNYLSRKRLSSLLLGIPQTYPPKPLRGLMVSSFLTPSKEVQWTYPKEAAAEVDAAAGGDYIIDVKDFRTNDKAWLIEQIIEMTKRRFTAFKNLLKKGFDFNMMVEMGTDRIHHGYWRYIDPTHRLYEKGNKYENVIRDYYELIDAEIGEILDILPKDTSVMIVSDHGAKAMVGAIAINEFFIKEGLLTLKEQPTEQIRMKNSMVDWSKTKCWGEGGYYSRVFFNIKGREPQGQIPPEEVDQFRADLIKKIEGICDEKGNNIGTKVMIPAEMYREVKGIAPDLVVYLGNLDWRSSGSIGVGGIHLFENDTGPDDANHAENGIFIMRHPDSSKMRKSDQYSIFDIAPTILKYFGLPVPEDMIGQSILK